MKSLYFTEEHDMFRDSVRLFVEKEIVPFALEWEQDKKIPRALFKKLGDQGFLGINHKEAYGGSDVDIFYSVVYLEELAKSSFAGVCAGVAVHQYMATNHIAEAGSHEIKEKYLRPSIEGTFVGAIAVSEPDAGSDVGSLKTTAVRVGDEYVINGSKTFITNGVYSDYVVVACKTDTKAGINGISLIIVDRDTPGFTATKLNKMGLHSSDTGELAFDNVKVPVTNIVGKENMGFFYIMESFQLERLVAGILGIGGGEKCIDMTLKYMGERETFGRKINKYQVIRHDIVQLATELEAAKQLTYNTCWLYQQGEVPVKESSMVKMLVTELSNKIVDHCLQYFGGYGYMEDYPIERAYRDSRVGTIVGGTTQIMKEILSKIIIDDVKYKKVYNEEGESAATGSKVNEWGNPSNAKEILMSLPLRIRPDKVAGQSTVFHFDISGENGGQYTVNIKDGKCVVSESLTGESECVITTDSETYRQVEMGEMAPEMAVMGGKIRISNLQAMMQFSRWFKKVK